MLRNYDHQQHVRSLLNLLSFFSNDLDPHSNNGGYGGYCDAQTVTMYNTIYQTVVSMILLGARQRHHVLLNRQQRKLYPIPSP